MLEYTVYEILHYQKGETTVPHINMWNDFGENLVFFLFSTFHATILFQMLIFLFSEI